MTPAVRAHRVAVISDVHGNALAMAAVAAAVEAEKPDAVVFGGDLTWGSLPESTWDVIAALARSVGERGFFVRGNAERRLAELDAGTPGEEPTLREKWLLDQHSAETLTALARFPRTVSLEIEGLGPTLFCHGSPRSDEELVTPGTPEERVRAFADGVSEHVLVSAHTHIQFDRQVAGVRSINPGSVGMPYEGAPGAYWALLGPGVEFRRTEYDVAAAAAAYRNSGDPLAEPMVETLLNPPSPVEVIAHAEALEFSG